jgi:hypothetical protein
MKKILQHPLVHKKENERSKAEKLARNLVFFGVVIFAAIMAYAVVNTEAQVTEGEIALVAMNI